MHSGGGGVGGGVGAILGKIYIKRSSITILIAWKDQLIKYFIIEPPVERY